MGPILNGYKVTDVNRALQVTLRDLEPDGITTASRNYKSQLAPFTPERQCALGASRGVFGNLLKAQPKAIS
jgi:hypothetical protein